MHLKDLELIINGTIPECLLNNRYTEGDFYSLMLQEFTKNYQTVLFIKTKLRIFCVFIYPEITDSQNDITYGNDNNYIVILPNLKIVIGAGKMNKHYRYLVFQNNSNDTKLTLSSYGKQQLDISFKNNDMIETHLSIYCELYKF
jgi:hypothetical protein